MFSCSLCSACVFSVFSVVFSVLCLNLRLKCVTRVRAVADKEG